MTQNVIMVDVDWYNDTHTHLISKCNFWAVLTSVKWTNEPLHLKIKTHLISNSLCQDVFVKWSCEVTLKKLIVINSLSNDSSNKLEIAKMIGIDVRKVVNGISDPITSTRLEQSVIWVEDLSGDDDIPFSE